MSRIGKLPITIPQGVECNIQNGSMTVRGPKGTLDVHIPKEVQVNIDTTEKCVSVDVPDKNNVKQKAYWGLTRQLIANAVAGVVEPFKKSLEFEGVGFRVEVQGKNIKMEVGFSHPVNFELPESVEASVEKNTLTLSGIDKQRVGEMAAQIRRVRKAEPYKGKGIRYSDEVIIRKAGKTGK